MQIAALEIKNFRCFTSFKCTLSGNITLIEGPNGSGKTSILEALHYACYGKSFRTTSAHELVQHETDSSFIKIIIDQACEQHVVQIGISKEKRVIKVNGQKIVSYKDLVKHYRSITITEDDILIVKGSPEHRRIFLDQALLVQQPTYATLIKLYRRVLKQRTSLLLSDANWSTASYTLWTEKLWEVASQVAHMRVQFLKVIESEMQILIKQFFPELASIQLIYKAATHIDTPYQWIESQCERERQARRTLFGPQLEDFEIIFSGTTSRAYASRGQQKLLAVLLKVAHYFLLDEKVIILLDDFMTDFDDERACKLINLFLEKKAHVICTVPSKKNALSSYLKDCGAQILELS